MVELAGHARGATLIDERKFSTDHGGIPRINGLPCG